MHYAEHPLPPELDGLVAAVWTLAHDGDPGEWIEHEATPDGCIELIRRHAGRSAWDGDQPEIFATGLGETPIRFGFSGDAAFTGIKLWPWAWEALGGTPCPLFAARWIAIPEGPLADLARADDRVDRLATRLADVAVSPLARAMLFATRVSQLRDASGMTPRMLQRWFEAHIGMPPRAWLRVRRFHAAMLELQRDDQSLATHAAEQGYADQAHMARDFRGMAGMAPRDARAQGRGPFLPKG